MGKCGVVAGGEVGRGGEGRKGIGMMELWTVEGKRGGGGCGIIILPQPSSHHKINNNSAISHLHTKSGVELEKTSACQIYSDLAFWSKKKQH